MEVSLAFLEKLGKFDKQISNVIQSLRAQMNSTLKENEEKNARIDALLTEMVHKDTLNMNLAMKVCDCESKNTELEFKLRQKDTELGMKTKELVLLNEKVLAAQLQFESQSQPQPQPQPQPQSQPLEPTVVIVQSQHITPEHDEVSPVADPVPAPMADVPNEEVIVVPPPKKSFLCCRK